jgi:hypothetical protein
MENLNPYLQPLGAPVSQLNENVNSAFDFSQNVGINSVTPTKVSYLPINKISSGTILVQYNLGSGTGGSYMILDGGNNRISVNDGTTNRIVIGNV